MTETKEHTYTISFKLEEVDDCVSFLSYNDYDVLSERVLTDLVSYMLKKHWSVKEKMKLNSTRTLIKDVKLSKDGNVFLDMKDKILRID